MSAITCKTIDMDIIEVLNKSPHKMFCGKGHNIYDKEECCSWCGESKKRTEEEQKRYDLLSFYIHDRNKSDEDSEDDTIEFNENNPNCFENAGRKLFT